VKSILIIKTSALGDVIQTFPVLEYLRRRYPEARIDWVVEKAAADLLSGHPFLTQAHVIDTKMWRKKWWRRQALAPFLSCVRALRGVEYDLLIDLQGNTKSALFTLLSKSKLKIGFGFHSAAEKPNLLVTHRRYEVSPQEAITERYLSLVKAHFHDEEAFHPRGIALKLTTGEEQRLQKILEEVCVQKGPFWMVAFGSKWKNKQLSEETLQEVLSILSQRHNPYFFFPFGNREEELLAQRLHAQFPERSDLLGDLTLPLWQNLMTHSDLLLAMDSAALHLCATTQTPSFSFFGPSSAQIYKPVGPQHGFFQGSCPYGYTFERRCAQLRSCTTGACLKEVSASALIASFEKWLVSIK
jgi:heptosyltransferase I